MGSVSADNQSIPISGDEMAEDKAFSSTVHKVILWVIAVIIGGLLQLVKQQSSVLDTHNVTFHCAFAFILLCIVLRVRETTHRQPRPSLVTKLIGYASHFFGSLAAILLISVVSAVFAMVLFLLWFLWLSAVVYTEVAAKKSITALPISALPQSVSNDTSTGRRRQQNIENPMDSAQQHQTANPAEPISNMQLSSLQCNVQERLSQKAMEFTSVRVMIV